MIRKAATSLRLSTRVAELCHSEKPHTTRFGHATIVQRLTSSLVNPSPASREATSAAVADGGGSTGSGYTPIPACLTTTSTTGPKKTADHATRAATSAPSNGAGKAGSTARIIGVSEADAAGGGGSGGGGAGNSSNRCYYWASDDAEQARTGRFVAEPGPPQTTETKAFQTAEAMLAHLLPSGFPSSVRHTYRTYAGWQFTAMTASAAAGVMSTQALLFAMGLGAGAIPLAATLNWVIKDGLGQLGGVAFSSLVNTRFDANPKLWRMVAAVSLDASTVLELLSPLAPAYFLPIASVANIGKNVSFLAASASRAAIHNMLSLKGNLADMTAKSGAQTILACMVGTGAGVALSTLLGSEFQAIVPVCLGLSAVHLGANYMSVRQLGVPTFDSQRLEIVTDAMVHGGGSREMLTPQDMAAREKFVLFAVREKLGLDPSPTVAVGSRLEEAVRDWGELEELCQACQGLPFLLSVRGDLAQGTAEVHVLLLEGCGARGVLAGGFVAGLAKRLLVERGLSRPPPGRRRGGALLLSPRLGGDAAEPTGEILPDVVAEALRQGGALLASFPKPKPGAVRGKGGGGGGGEEELQESQRREGGGAGAGCRLGDTIEAELSARAERSGWNTSVLFLEKTGAVRLRLVCQSEKGDDRRRKTGAPARGVVLVPNTSGSKQGICL